MKKWQFDKPKTKLAHILRSRFMSQRDLYELIKEQNDTPIGYDRLSKMVSGKQTNIHTDTLFKICNALDVTPNDLLETNTDERSDESGDIESPTEEKE